MEYIIKHQEKKYGTWTNLTGVFKGNHTRESVRKHYVDEIKPLFMRGTFAIFERENRKVAWRYTRYLS